jgi:hypothetical protein
MTDHALASRSQIGAAHIARCVCGGKWLRRFPEQAEQAHAKHASEEARVAARRPSAAENRTAVEAMHEPLFGDQPEEGTS